MPLTKTVSRTGPGLIPTMRTEVKRVGEKQPAGSIGSYSVWALIASFHAHTIPGEESTTSGSLDIVVQAIGAFCLVGFALARLHLAGVTARFAARLTELAAAVLIAVCLMDASFEVDIVQATAKGHAQAALTSFDLTYTFVHIFGLAPPLTLFLGLALAGTRLLPRVLVYLAIGLGAAMMITGFAGLFSPTAAGVYLGLLIVQTIWYVVAEIALVLRAGHIESLDRLPMLDTQ
jgi:hypothetical protein